MKIVMKVDEQNRNEWLAAKQKTVGASEVAAIVGLNKWVTPLKLWAVKTGKVPPDEENWYMHMGKRGEDLVKDAFLFKCKEAEGAAPYITSSQDFCVHDTIEFASATPDFWISDTVEVTHMQSSRPEFIPGKLAGILETKYQRAESVRMWEEGLPRSFHIQTMWQLGVTGLEYAHVASLCGGFDFRSARVEFDREIFEVLVEKAGEFMDLVKRDIPPQAHGDDIKLLSALNPINPETNCVLGPEAIEHVRRYVAAKRSILTLTKRLRPFEEELKSASATLQQMMAGAACATAELEAGGQVIQVRCNAKTINRSAYSAKATSYTRFDAEVLNEPEEALDTEP